MRTAKEVIEFLDTFPDEYLLNLSRKRLVEIIRMLLSDMKLMAKVAKSRSDRKTL